MKRTHWVAVIAVLCVGAVCPGAGADVPVRLVGQWGGLCQAVAVVGNRAYIGEGSSVVVLNISTPSNPIKLGRSKPLPGLVCGVAVSGNYAHVADEVAGLQVLDISNPANPVRVGGYDTSGYARGVAVSDNYAYVADGSAGLQVIEGLSQPQLKVVVAPSECYAAFSLV